MFEYEYPMPAVTVDAIIFTKNFSHLLFIRRKSEPHKGDLAFVGGFMNIDETLVQAVAREVKEEVALDISEDRFVKFKLLDAPNRDSRQRVLSQVFAVSISHEEAKTAKAGDDAESLFWMTAENVVKFLKSDLPMSFDHKEVLAAFIQDAEKMLNFRKQHDVQ